MRINRKQKKKILIIDDEKDFTAMVKLNLEGTGKYEVMEENKGVNGVAAARQFNPDLILLDLLMLDMEGSEVASRLEKDASVKDIPIVFLTAMIAKKEVEDKRDIKGRVFVAKPVDSEKLINVIEKNIKTQ